MLSSQFGRYGKDKIKISKWLFAMCWLAYCTVYLGRINYYAALASVVEEGLFTKSQAGLMGTLFFFCYGGGQLFSGILGDTLSPYKMIMAGLFVSALSNLLLPLQSSYIIMALLWGINGLAQSLIWPPILYIITNVLSEEVRAKAFLSIAATTPVGTFLAYFIAMLLMRSFSWKSVYYFAALVLALVLILWCMVSVLASRELGHGKRTCVKKDRPHGERSGNFRKLMVSSGGVLVALSVLGHGMLKDGVNSWVPTMITESYGVSPSFSVFLTMFLPIINFGGAFLADFCYKKLMHQNEMKVAALLFGASMPPLVLLLFIGKIHMLTSIILLSVFTTIMLGVNYITITVLPVRFAKYNRASTVSGLLNSVTYIGCAVSNFGFGFLSDQIGWQKTIGVWVMISILAVIICLLSLKNWNRFINSKADAISVPASAVNTYSG